MTKFIVAEISKSWEKNGDDGKALLNTQFEQVIETNLQRGYSLKEWKLSSLYYDFIADTGETIGTVQETIIAIFERIDKKEEKA